MRNNDYAVKRIQLTEEKMTLMTLIKETVTLKINIHSNEHTVTLMTNIYNDMLIITKYTLLG